MSERPHYRPAGQADLACGADHTPWAVGNRLACCSTDMRQVRCPECRDTPENPTSGMSPSESATSPAPVPAAGGGSRPNDDGPTAAPPRPARGMPARGWDEDCTDGLHAYCLTGAEGGCVCPCHRPPVAELVLGGRAPGLYIDGKRIP
jgi:hypothetical protein